MVTVEQIVRSRAPKYNLDPDAVIHVLMGEGGLRWGAVGDQGTSFGPAQLHIGGALPRGKGPKWANSPAGLDYALRQMAKVAAGLRGPKAINAIIRRFERPADPDASVAKALERWKAGTAGGPGPQQANVPGPGAAEIQPVAAQPAAYAPGGALEQAQTLAGGGKINFLSWMNAEARARSFGGTTVPPTVRRGGQQQIPAGQNETITKILAAAHAQRGKPYIWGAESPQEGGFDCSGLIDWAFKQAGIDLPGRLTTYSAMKLGRSVKGKKMLPGDILITNGGKHMVMYVGGGRVIAAPHTGEVVQYQPVKQFRGDIVDVRRMNFK